DRPRALRRPRPRARRVRVDPALRRAPGLLRLPAGDTGGPVRLRRLLRYVVRGAKMTRPSAGSPSAMQSPTVPRQEPVGHPPPPGGGPVLHRPARPALAAAPREQRAGRLRRWLLSLSGVLACLGLWHLATLGNSRTDISGPLLVAE